MSKVGQDGKGDGARGEREGEEARTGASSRGGRPARPAAVSAAASPAGEGQGILDQLSASARNLILATPPDDRPKIKAVLIETGEEGDLLDLLPEMNRAMTVCPGKLIGKAQKGEIRWSEMQRVFDALHDSIHGVRQAILTVIRLAGGRGRGEKGRASEEAAGAEGDPSPGRTELAAPRTPGGPDLEAPVPRSTKLPGA